MRVDRRHFERAARWLSAAALLVVGGIHIEQYVVAHFSVIPTIGPLFLVNFIGATACALALVVPLPSPRVRALVDVAAATGGIAISAGAFAALLISEHTPLFGFSERGYRLEIVVALVSEGIAMLALLGLVWAIKPRVARIRGLRPALPDGASVSPRR
ncbi:MAG: hypothetical protein JO153_15945 [Solirubrobacterales bacterium]|nr:hypothetical protein [Solirubrobacterales bacterium]